MLKYFTNTKINNILWCFWLFKRCSGAAKENKVTGGAKVKKNDFESSEQYYRRWTARESLGGKENSSEEKYFQIAKDMIFVNVLVYVLIYCIY